MPATPEEVSLLRRAYERDHRKPARVLAELLLVGNSLLQSKDALEGSIGERFEAFVFDSLDAEGVHHAELAGAVRALQDLRVTLAALDDLPE